MSTPRPTPLPGDARDLRILFWCYIAMTILTFAAGVWLYYQLDALMAQAEQRLLDWQLVDPQDWMMLRQDPEHDPMRATLWMMQVLVIVMTPVHALVYITAAWFLHKLKGYWTLVVIAVFNMLAAPIGTIVSIFHLIVFFRPSVRALFRRGVRNQESGVGDR